jgi:ammonia channel protein AmtB
MIRFSEYRIVSFAAFALALSIFIGSLLMPIGTPLKPGPGLVPLILSGLMMLVAGIVLILPADKAVPKNDPPAANVWIILAVLGASILMFEWAGFAATTFVSISLLLIVVERRPILNSVLLAALFSGGCYLLFERVLQVDLP